MTLERFMNCFLGNDLTRPEELDWTQRYRARLLDNRQFNRTSLPQQRLACSRITFISTDVFFSLPLSVGSECVPKTPYVRWLFQPCLPLLGPAR